MADDEGGKIVFKNLKILRQFKHPNIVQLVGFSALRMPVLLVMEHFSGKIKHKKPLENTWD
jgi:hypothetical protein